MKHSVIFNNCENHWDNALPFGNGTFGCMLFYEKNKLYMPMNHYEVYYTSDENTITLVVQPEDLAPSEEVCKNPGALHAEYLRRADANQPPEGEPFCLYRTDRELAFKKKPYGILKFSNSYPTTGELIFSFSKKLSDAQSKLALYLEDAKGELTLENDDEHISLETIATRRDCVINSIKQSSPGLLERITISFPQNRDCVSPSVLYEKLDSRTLRYTVKHNLCEDKTFTFCGILRFVGTEIELEGTGNGCAEIALSNSGKEISVLTGIFTDWKHENPADAAVLGVDEFEAQYDALLSEHRIYWNEFFDCSSISLPDKFLEKVYFINQYALDCCSGRGGVMKHHACGLNGLWAIRHPNLWGSMWYWDVNIQAAFAGVFSSNRLELGKVFSDGLLSYRKLAKRFAHEVHNLPGCATDYPYHFYYSCWSWCAQYLWFLYEYSLDEEYLRNEAYPLFLELCEFTLGIFEYDEKSGTYVVYPDISPEQGPLAHNTTITVACTKYLLKFTLEAAKILSDSSPLLLRCEELLKKLPEYSLSEPGNHGVHFKDSPDAPDNLWIRHPSMLMPVFPIGEYDIGSNENIKQIISNTIDFLEDKCETGIFGCSWIAAAAARIGKGQTALRILYEKGIDHMLRSNGLTAEATDRFMNHCLIARQPLYYPCMMEFSGEMLAAVNEMLMQSQNGVIRIFPAIPDGDPEYGRMLRNGYSISDYTEFYKSYDAWKDVSFTKLLAKGAFEVSASLRDRAIEYVLVHSKKGGRVRLTSEFFGEDVSVFCDGNKVDFELTDGAYSFETSVGKSYLLAQDENVVFTDTDASYDEEISSHETYTRRKIYIGEDPEAVYRKKLDYFTRDWFLGDTRMANHTVYKFDFTGKTEKDYTETFPLQCYASEEHMMRSMDFVRLGAENFTSKLGYGFSCGSDVRIVERNAPDVIRCDFAEGERDAEFIIEAPRGQYEILVISGDEFEDSVTIAHGENSRKSDGSVVLKGTFQCEIIPMIQEYDTPIRVKLSTLPGYRWKLNALMLNVIKGY